MTGEFTTFKVSKKLTERLKSSGAKVNLTKILFGD